MDILQQLAYHIARREDDRLTQELTRLSFGEMSRTHLDKLQAYLLKAALATNNDSALVIILDMMEQYAALRYPNVVATCLCLNSYLTDKEIRTVYSRLPRSSFDYFQDLVNMEDDDQAFLLAQRLLVILPPLDRQDWVVLMDLATPEVTYDDDGEKIIPIDTYLLKFFRAQVGKFTHVSVPKWVRKVTPLPIFTYVPVSTYVAIDHLIRDISGSFLMLSGPDKEVDAQDLQETFIRHYSTASLAERRLLCTLPQPEGDDISLFQEFGPLNSIYSAIPETDTDHICVKYGGCRMLLCTEFESSEDQDDEEDWFRGTCDLCELTIDRRHYAVRCPLIHGGWRGCYCSWRCVEVSRSRSHPELLQLVKDKLLVMGIRERD